MRADPELQASATLSADNNAPNIWRPVRFIGRKASPFESAGNADLTKRRAINATLSADNIAYPLPCPVSWTRSTALLSADNVIGIGSRRARDGRCLQTRRLPLAQHPSHYVACAIRRCAEDTK